MTCICGHPKREHDNEGMCRVDYLLCACVEFVSECWP